MLKTIKIFIIIALILAIIKATSMHIHGNSIPNFKYETLNGNIVNGSDIPNNKTFFIFFDPNCSHCELIAELVKSYKNTKLDATFVFITREKDLNKINLFLIKNALKNTVQYVLIDKYNTFGTDFGQGFNLTVPTVLLYDKNRNFIAKIIEFEQILKV